MERQGELATPTLEIVVLAAKDRQEAISDTTGSWAFPLRGKPEGKRRLVWGKTERKTATMNLGKLSATRSAYRIECMSVVLLQVNCRNIYDKILYFWYFVDIYNPNVVISMA
jgi:hypothetical protein